MTLYAPFVVIKNVAKRWNGQLGVEGVSLSIPRGSFVALLGPSGCGKSTTLRLLSGLELPDEGEISIDGRDVTLAAPSERNLSMVFQSYALFPHLNVAENVVFGLKVRKVGAAERREKLHRALEITGLLGYEKRKPGECVRGSAPTGGSRACHRGESAAVPDG
jgi:sn-glycerol 3-phosphate transport system ATP-binding protein